MARIDELNVGAIDEGFESWTDPALENDKKAVARIKGNLTRNKGKYIEPMAREIASSEAMRGTKKPLNLEVIKYFRPDLLNDKGELDQAKWKKLDPTERGGIKGQVTDKFEHFKKTGLFAEAQKQGQAIKKFLDKFIEFETKGLNTDRLFVGGNLNRWLPEHKGAISGANELIKELYRARKNMPSSRTASSFQFDEDFRNPKYQNALKTINEKYVTGKTHGGDNRGALTGGVDPATKDKLTTRYLNDLYNKELPEFLKSKEFLDAPDIEKAIAAIDNHFSDPILYPNIYEGGASGKAAEFLKRPYDLFKSTAGTGIWKGKQRSDLKVWPLVANKWLSGTEGKKALDELEKYVKGQREIGNIDWRDPGATEAIDKRFKLIQAAKANPLLHVFFKSSKDLGITPRTGKKAIPGARGAEADPTGTSKRAPLVNRMNLINTGGSPLIPKTILHYFSREMRQGKSKAYTDRFLANLKQIDALKLTPDMYRKNLTNLNKVLTAQLGGLQLAGEHRLGLSMLDKSFNPNYVTRLVLSPRAFNDMKGKYIEKVVTAKMNNPLYKPETKAKIYNEAATKFAKDFELPESIKRTLPKFDVEKGKLIETQVEKTVPRFGVDEMGNLKATVKNALVEQALIDKKMPGRAGKFAETMLKKADPKFKNVEQVSNILKLIEREGPNSSKLDGMVNRLVEGEFEKTVNAESMKAFGKTFSSDIAKQDPGLIQKAFQKVSGKGGRIGALLAGLGAVGAGTWAMTGGAKAEEAPTTDQMSYNATEGKFVQPNGDPETQEGILNWIADHPIIAGVAPVPVGIGAGLGADAMNAKNVGNFFKSMKFMLPPAYAAEKLYQYKEGQDMGEMFTNPLDAVWAMALDNKTSRDKKWDYYRKAAQKAAGYSGVTRAQVEAQQLGLKPSTWKNIGKATMAPRSLGTSLVFPFAGPKAGAGLGMKIFRGAARLAPLGPIPMALMAGSMAWDKYKFNKKVGDHVDALRSQGMVSEEDAETMNTIYKQGWLGTTAIGAKLLGSEELMFEGELLDIEGQKRILSGMKDFYGKREDVATQERVGDRQEDFFSWFSGGGRVGLAEGGNKKPFGSMTRRGFLKWLVGSIAAGVAAVSGRGLKQAAKTITPTVTKAIPTKFAGVEGMPLWFPRAVAKIKAHGKLIEMADKHYVGGDIYEMMIPVKRTYSRGPRGEGKEIRTELEKVTMEENPLSGEISMHWTGTDNFGDDAVRSIEFKPGQAGYQKFGVDDPEAAAQGIKEYQRVKVEEPEFTYTQPDQSNPYRDDIEYLDIFEEGDEIVKGLEDMTGGKNMVAKDGTVIDVSAEGKGVDEAFKKKIFKDIEGEGQIIPEPEGVGISKEGDVYGEEGYSEIIEGVIPDHLKKKAEGGIIETGNIARRPGAVPPLSGPNPQGTGIVGLFSNPKRVKVG